MLDELLATLDDETATDELELAGTLDDELGQDAPPTMPKGAGWLVQVLREIQLRLFSQPQPLWVVLHKE